MVATYFDKAMVGTFTSEGEHFAEWKETEPVSREDVAAELGKALDELSSQEILVAGMLRPAHLLDIVRNFTLHMPIEGRTVKIVGRYQQYRAVQRSIERLTTGKTRIEDGEFDRRGGIVWHTQGSGKSLTMVFLIRKMRTLPELRRFKVVAVTDRTDLQRQLSDTAALTGETVEVGKSVAKVKELLARPGTGPGLRDDPEVPRGRRRPGRRERAAARAGQTRRNRSGSSTRAMRSSSSSTRRTALTPAPCTRTS